MKLQKKQEIEATAKVVLTPKEWNKHQYRDNINNNDVLVMADPFRNTTALLTKDKHFIIEELENEITKEEAIKQLNERIETAKHTIDVLETMNQAEANALKLSCIKYKDHYIYKVDLRNINKAGYYWKYIYLTFKNNRNIKYLHEIIREDTNEAIYNYYSVCDKIFTIEELKQMPKSYNDYYKMLDYWNNNLAYTFDVISIYDITEKLKEKYKYYYYMYYFKNLEDLEIYKDVSITLDNNRINMLNDNELFYQAIRYELSNHEACITCDYTEALSSLGLCFDKLDNEKQTIVKEELHRQIYSYEGI